MEFEDWEISDEWDDIVYNEIPIKAEFYQIDEIESLLKTSCLSVEESNHIQSMLYILDYSEANLILNKLREKQIDRISSGLNYNQGEIIKHLRKLR